MPTPERQALLGRIVASPITKANLHKVAWEKINPKIQLKLADALAPKRAEPAPKDADLQRTMAAAGWAAEDAAADNTIWTKTVNKERYTAILAPESGSMEVTVLVGAVDTQIASFKADDPKSAADAASKAVASDAPVPAKAASAAQNSEQPAKPDVFANNKLFTSDKVAAARERMKKKLGTLNSGIDPEMMSDGIFVAAAYIEAGVRSFADFANSMVSDLGEGVKPYLLSAWEGARHYPGLDTKGMTSATQSAQLHAAMMTPEVKEQAAEAVGTVVPAPAKRTKKTGKSGDMTLTQDWGVEHINGYGDSTREEGNDTKDAFLRETRDYLRQVSLVLQDSGFVAHADMNGKSSKIVSVNESGSAGSGDVSLTMHHPDTGTNVYVTIGDTALRGMVPSTPSGIAIMYRVATGSDRFAAKGGNTWAPVDLSASDLAALVSKRIPATIGTSAPEAATRDQADERTTVQGDGTKALERVASGAGEGAERSGRTGASTAGGRDQRTESGSGTDAAGVQSPRSGGGGAERVHPAEAGDGGALRKPRRVKKDAAKAAAERAIGPDTRPEVNGEPASAPNVPAADFQITDETRLGQGGEVAKFNDNLAAIRALKAIEAENRRATPDEQATLARYVGWGGLANAFPDPLTGKHKAAWETRGKELRELLDDAEFAAARRSTRNAHYTSKPVVQAMWRAVERLGFKGGLALETSMGVGNFLGLKPQSLPASFVGVEYDSLTSRIAQALYPQATVLHSGFQNVPLADNAFALSIGNPPFGSESLRFQFKPELNGTSIHNQFFRASMDALRPGGIQAMVVSRFLMDAQDKSTRLALAKQARLVAAIRLPDTAFKENARTEVVTDIIILQKLTPAEADEASLAIGAYLDRGDKFGRKTEEQQALAAKVPAWVETADLADPLGGEAMKVNTYFRDNKANILGVLERSGSMQHGADITVRLDDAASLERLLTEAVDRLPQNIQDLGAEVIAATEQRHKSMSDALRIAMADQEVGHVQLNRDGALERVVERETPEGGIEMGMQAITAESPWSDQLMQDDKGRWYRTEVVMDEAGKPVKFVKPDGKVTRNNVTQRVTYETDAEVPDSMRLGKTGFERLSAAVGLRDSLKRQIVLETSDAAKGVMDANRRELAKRYEAFVAKFGPVNRPANLNLLMTMPDGGLTAALEVAYQPEVTAARSKTSGLPMSPEVAKPAPILTERVVPKYEPATSAASASDALAITLAERGRVDMERIAALRGLSVEEVMAELQAGDKPLVFKDPESQEWETADAYLSGNVHRKLNAAKAARAETNIKALESVQPAAWGAEDVTVMLGSTWVPPKVYADFAEHLSGGQAKASFSHATNAFSLSVTNATAKAEEWSSQGARVDYILGRLMNSQPVVVMYKDENGSLKRDAESTALAQLKAKEISAEFLDWVFKDGERRTALVDLFNEKFNTRVVRQRDGSHLTLPGKVPDSIIGMRRHQKNVIWRGITDNALLMDHAVGAGKTFAAIARAMERRRMGLSKKPMIVVPNHLIDQWASDVYRLYPGAKVLAAGKKDFEAKRRRRLFGKIATGDWDIVLVPHSSFGFIGIDPSTEQRFLQQEMDQALEAVKDAEEQAAEDGTDTGFRKPFGVKEAERLVEKIQVRMDKLNSGTKDRLLTFEQLGVDDLTVDEAHEFKNLYYSSRMTGVRGMGDKTGSRKANDLYNKVRVLQDNPANSVSFLTGTPISNSAVEMYTVMRFLAPSQLKDMGLEHFDAWRAQFVEASAAFEPTESGSLKEVTRLGRSWSNMRSLMDLYYEFTDAVSLEDIQKWYSEDNGGKPFPVPKVKGGDRQLVKVQPTPAQEAMLREVIAGFDDLPDIKDPYERNAARLRLMDRARKVSLDVRAVDPRNTSTEENGKLAQASANIKRIYDAWSADKGTQMVFLDRSVPRAKGDDKIIKEYDALVAKRDEAMAKGDDAAFQAVQESIDRYDANEIAELRSAQGGGWNAYQQIKDNLIAAGIPANEIRFIQEANNDEQKQALFDAVNSGKVRVLMGSSQRMGAGTNAQKRLVGLHHIDVTWKPSDIEQREGRIIRQGNDLLAKYGPNFEVEILAYATERTVDAKMWDLNATKLKTINGIRKYSGAFTMDFEDADSVSMAEMAALASGNPLLLERVKTESEINLLDLQERAFRRRMYGAQDAVQNAERTIERNPQRIKDARAREEAASKAVEAAAARHAARSVTVEGKEYTKLLEAYAAAKAAIDAQQGDKPTARYSLTVDGQRLTTKESIESAISESLGDASVFDATINGKVVTQRVTAARELAAEATELTKGITVGDSRTKTVGTMLGYNLVLDATAYDGGKGGGLIDAAVSLVDDAGATVASVASNAVAVNQSFVTANLRNPVSDLFGSIERITRKSDAEYLQRQLDRAKADIDSLRGKLGQTFPKAEELATKRARLRELVSLLDGSKVDQASDANEAEGLELDAKLSSAVGQSSGLPLAAGQALAKQFADLGLNKINVARSLAELPADQRQRLEARNATGVRGVYFPKEDQVWVVLDNVSTPEEFTFVAVHEAFHRGLRAIFGKDALPIMRQMYLSNPKLRARADALAKTLEVGRDEAIEEALADMAAEGSLKELKGWKRLLAMIKDWANALAKAVGADITFTDAMVETFVAGVSKAGLRTDPAGAVQVLTEAPDGAIDDTPMMSRAAVLGKATEALNQAFSHPGKLSWWHKTVGSMYNLAERSPEFKKVFQAGQSFLDDVSFYANEAANMAPKILPKLDDLKDVLKSPISFTDSRAISAPIFQGTLSWARDVSGKPRLVDDLTKSAEAMSAEQKASILLKAGKIPEGVLAMWRGLPVDQFEANIESRYASQMLKPGVVWSDAELKTQFGLNPEQVGLYKEFRRAVDRSLDDTAKAEMLRFGGKDVDGLKAQVMAAPTLERARDILRAHLLKLGESDVARAEQLADTAAGINERADKITKLKAEGYAPLSRFGRYSVDVVVEGERKYFGLFESQRDANRMAEKMGQEFGKAYVSQGTMSQREFELFQGITPESLELFGSMLGLNATGDDAQDQAFQEYLKRSKNNHSAMKRLIHRQGISGYSEDAGRVLASFVYSNARQASAALHMGDLGEAVTAIPKQQGELKDVAVALADYIKKPREEAQVLRGFLFAQYLGGSVASALINLTQPMAVTFPYLSQFGGARKASAELVRAVADMAKRGTVYEPGLAKALKRAEEQGVVSPQEVHQLMAQARGAATLTGGDGTKVGQALATANNTMTRLSVGWGKLFGYAEQINRRSTFIAAYRIAVANGMQDPSGFASKAVNETQFVNNRGNKMVFGRGTVGATLMTFKSYSINYLELFHRLATRGGPEGKKAAALMLGMLILTAGAGGLPFEEDIEDVIDMFAQRVLGRNFSSGLARQEFLVDLFGQAGADFVERGLTGLPGSPLDVSGRLSMANLIPMTGLLPVKRDHSRDVVEVLGAAGDFGKRLLDAGGQLIAGNVGGAMESAAPRAVANAKKGIDMFNTGAYRDDKGYKVMDTTMLEGAMKAIGFQPSTVSKSQEANAERQQSKDFYNLHAQEIRAKWARGIAEKDPGLVAEARGMVQAWNEQNPDQRIVVNMAAVMKRSREMMKSKDQRIAENAPKALRAQFKRDIAEERQQ